MEILVVGGNGFVGRHLVQALQERGDRIRVLALAHEDTSWLEQHGVAVHRGDVRNADSLVEPMSGVDAVFNLAAMMDVWRPVEDYRAVNVLGAVNVCRVARASRVRRLVHMSSSSVYGTGVGGPIDEESPLRPFDDPYPVTKAEGDLAVQAMIKDHGLPAVVIRPDQIFGPGDHLHFGQMADRLRAGTSIVVGAGHNAMPFVYVSDLIDGLLLALHHARAVGEAFNITNDSPLTQLQFLTAISQAIGAKGARVHVPYSALYAAGTMAERTVTLTRSGRRPPITRFGVAFLGTENRYSIAKARLLLGYTPHVPIDEGIRRTAAWYLVNHARSGGAADTAATVQSRA